MAGSKLGLTGLTTGVIFHNLTAPLNVKVNTFTSVHFAYFYFLFQFTFSLQRNGKAMEDVPVLVPGLRETR